MSDAPDRTPRSAKLPGLPPNTTKKIVVQLAEIAPVSSARLASHLGVELTGRVATTLAASKLYGFVAANEDNKLVVTERGEAFIGDDEESSLQAARDGVMSTGFAPVIAGSMTKQADPSRIAIRFEEDHGLKAAPAKARAEVLAKAAGEAQLVSNGKFDAAAIEDTIERIGKYEAEAPAPTKAARSTSTAKAETKIETPKRETLKKETPKREERSGPFVGAPSMQVVLQIDASKLTAQEIVTIAGKMKEIGASTSGS